MKQHRQEPTFTDPVCGMRLSHNTAAETAEYRGDTYYFCADVCRETFEADPEKYAAKYMQNLEES